MFPKIAGISTFRLFVNNKYYEYVDEKYQWEHEYNPEALIEYWNQNKWFLKRLYKSVYIN